MTGFANAFGDKIPAPAVGKRCRSLRGAIFTPHLGRIASYLMLFPSPATGEGRLKCN